MPDVLDPQDPNDAVEIAAREASGVPQNITRDYLAGRPLNRGGFLYPALEHAVGRDPRREHLTRATVTAAPVHPVEVGPFQEIRFDAAALAPRYDVGENEARIIRYWDNPRARVDVQADLVDQTVDNLAIALDIPREMIDPEAEQAALVPTFALEVSRLDDRYDPSIRELFEAVLGLCRYEQDTHTPNALLADMIINLLDTYERTVTRR